MIKTTKILNEEYAKYKNPSKKIERLVKEGKLFKVTRGLYETNLNISGAYLAASICCPSYLSFDYALSYYGLIPEAVYTFSSATFSKNKQKKFITKFGTFTYRDVPSSVYPLGLRIINENNYFFQMATVEKALCDKLYTIKPLQNISDIEILLFDDLRIYKDEFLKINKEDIYVLAKYYKCKNINLLVKYLRRN